ncbi:F1/F0 ATPase, subunit 2 [Litoreibacter ascidiaceicola]|uniref:F1/F0 ATPase, subunit 2 n=1 Tax=Litoreibacter ascidiaceicola TaxID=1486859 RepID=A0A1M5BNB4_9RHOB|nr:ATP synthase subunit I [Litoreibacter ascidiaceicola]SHF43971.1 F1/F0 ATPase, subunit 2 [Litoreibacter ascidiaceicola]
MMSFDWSSLILGLAIGAATSAVFFAGLGLGMRMALRSVKPVAVLVLSAAIRIAALLGVGWIVVEQGGPWSLLGYAAAFVIVRFISLTVASVSTPSGGAQ